MNDDQGELGSHLQVFMVIVLSLLLIQVLFLSFTLWMATKSYRHIMAVTSIEYIGTLEARLPLH